MAISMPLVSGAELAAHLPDQEVLVCDCRFAGDAAASHKRYESGHIPGAVHVYWLDDLSAADTTVTTLLPNEHEATTALGQLGVTDETFVIAYADCGNLYAARLWHVLTHYGHDRVALLDGGIEKWESEGRPVERGSAETKATAFRCRESGWQRGIAAKEILDRLDDPNTLGWSTCAGRLSSRARSGGRRAAGTSPGLSSCRGRAPSVRTARSAPRSRSEPGRRPRD
jgi:thiosulfate/3-mercaptopyruvate sulfurtransferase